MIMEAVLNIKGGPQLEFLRPRLCVPEDSIFTSKTRTRGGCGALKTLIEKEILCGCIWL